MFKPLPPGTVGQLTAPVQNYSRVLELDSALVAVINEYVGPLDWTYLYLAHGTQIEVIRVNSVGVTTAFVDRTQEGTARLGLPAGTKVYYDTTLAGIRDTIREQVDPITLTATGEMKVSGLNAHLDQVQVKGKGDLEIIRNAELLDGNIGKCKPFSCPGYILQWPTYTSHIYPINVIEAFTSGAELTYGSLHGASSIDYLDSNAELIAGVLTVTVGYRTYDKVLESVDSDAELISGVLTVTVGYRTYSEWSSETNSEKLDSSAELISGALIVTTGYITYSYWNPTYESLDSSAELISGSLT